MIGDVPSDPPPAGTGRLLIASEGEPARVARVTGTWEGTAVDPGTHRYGLAPALEARKTELLCLTPCAVDLPTGADDLVFTSLSAPTRTSTVEIAVPHGTTVVRHAIGTDKPFTPGYLLGVGATTSGVLLGIAGVSFLAVGAAADSVNGSDVKNTVTATGAVISVVAVAALVTGIVMMTQNQPERGPGATTTFRVP